MNGSDRVFSAKSGVFLVVKSDMSESTPEPNMPESVHDQSDCEYIHRSESRIKTRKLACSMGKVADITGSGMRMLVTKGELPEVGDVQSYTFSDEENSVEVKGSVKWVRNGSKFARRSEVGVEFVKLDQAVRDAILRLAVQGKLGISNKPGAAAVVEVEVPNLYAMLGVVHCASDDEIKSAYRQACMRWHPDVNSSPEATQRFDELNKAYSVLKDPGMRARYDERYGEQFQQAA